MEKFMTGDIDIYTPMGTLHREWTQYVCARGIGASTVWNTLDVARFLLCGLSGSMLTWAFGTERTVVPVVPSLVGWVFSASWAETPPQTSRGGGKPSTNHGVLDRVVAGGWLGGPLY